MVKLAKRLVDLVGPLEAVGLAEAIRDPRWAGEFATALEKAAASEVSVKRDTDTAPKVKRPVDIGASILNRLKVSQPEKYAVVLEIREQLLSHPELQSMDALRSFAETHDLSIGMAKSRKAAIPPFLKSLSELTMNEIQALHEAIVHYRPPDRSIERWREVITGMR